VRLGLVVEGEDGRPGLALDDQASVSPPKLKGGGAHSLAGEGAGVVDSDEGRDTLVL
jgi:hypothetical protein